MPYRGCVLTPCFIKLIRPAQPHLTDNADSSRSPVAPLSSLPNTMATNDEALEAFISAQVEKAKKRMQERLDELVKLEEEGKLPVYGMSH